MKKLLNSKFLSLYITIFLFFVLFSIGSVLYTGFFSLQTFLNLFIDNAFLIISASGMTMVLLIGGIDISVGSVIALTCMLSAYLLELKNFNPVLVMVLIILMGAGFGLLQGCLIHFFKIQPFIVTLAGLFFARGMTAVISTDTINIKNKLYTDISNYRIYLYDKSFISIGVVIALIVMCITIYIAHYTRFGRSVYAIGGNEQSARLMGLPVGKTKVLVYTYSGVCYAIAGIVFSFYMLSGYTLHQQGGEMDAIASAVIGGTSLTGGVGYVFGTLFGVLIQGVIQTLIMFQGTLSSWWTRIAVALLLCMFIMIQRLLTIRKDTSRKAKINTGKKSKQLNIKA
ncbi:MAG: ABC-type transporter, integral rane subunit [Eubacterium sp.]|nr:ABC-type transporter, integral rane subunit [Eubacterium sp.]